MRVPRSPKIHGKAENHLSEGDTVSVKQKILTKRRYGLLGQFMYDQLQELLGKVGISILFSIVFEDRDLDSNIVPLGMSAEDYKFGILGRNDVSDITAVAGYDVPPAEINERFSDGALCFGLRLREEVVAFTWCNILPKRLAVLPFKPSGSDAYIFDSFTSLDHRGEGLIALVYRYTFQELRPLGYSRLISYADYFNTPAIKFRNKLGSKPICLVSYVKIFRLFERSLVLKQYQQ